MYMDNDGEIVYSSNINLNIDIKNIYMPKGEKEI